MKVRTRLLLLSALFVICAGFILRMVSGTHAHAGADSTSEAAIARSTAAPRREPPAIAAGIPAVTG